MKKNIFKSVIVALMAVTAVNFASAQQPHVYINPGHGGYDSDDRNMVIYPSRKVTAPAHGSRSPTCARVLPCRKSCKRKATAPASRV